jgi:alpha-ketoglutarate-dependent taurine dioxygenase
MLVEAERMDDALSDQEALGDLVRTHLPKPSWPPLFIEPATETLLDHAAFIDWLVEKRPVLDRLIVNHGGIVLRRFPVRATEEFEAVIDVFPAFEQGYVGGITPRKVLGKKALESTALSSHYRINLHQEMAYAPDYPARIMFFAKVIPEEGGQTTIADMRRLTASLPDDLRSLFEERGYSSVRNYGAPGNTGRTDLEPDFLPWSQSFGSEDRGEVERRCGELGRRAIWNENGSLTTVV